MNFWEWFNDTREELGNRAGTFTQVFEYLDKFNRPVTIIETGCLRKDDIKGDGSSTILFDHYVQDRGGVVYTVDIEPRNTEYCRKLVSEQVKIHTGDSVSYLKWLAETSDVSPDLVYLDSLDYMEARPFLTALHCAKEFEAIKSIIRPDTLVVVDDTPGVFTNHTIPYVEAQGKGAFVLYHAEKSGAECLFHKWQVGWTHMVDGLTGLDKDLAIDQLIGRARGYVEADNQPAADKVYRLILSRTTKPKTGVERVARGEACVFYARIAAKLAAYGTAVDWFYEAIKADPRAVDYRIELVVKAYRPLNNWQLARQEAMRAVELEPENPHAWRILGDVEMTLCDAKRAINAYDNQLDLSPDDPNAMLDRCVMSLDTADYKLTTELANKVLKTDRRPDGLHVLAMTANRQGRHEEAIELFDKAIEAGCNNINTAHWNKSLSLHALGRFREGWIEHEYRRHEKNNPALSLAFTRFDIPCWAGEPPPASIHVQAEAGMGDNICTARFLKPLVEKGYDVRYETHKELVSLMRRSFPDVMVVERPPDYPGTIGLVPFDYHLPVGSMAYTLGTDIDTIPWDGPYLKPDPDLVAEYGLKICPYHSVPVNSGVKRVGLCWSSGIRDYGIWIAEYGKRKSMHFSQLKPILSNKEVQFVSLQVGPEREQNDGSVVDVLPKLPTWDDTAALVENLDLVITVDTSVAHLAGALGKPTWVMTQRDAVTWHFLCWRPGAKWNEQSLWYPSARVFRQHEFNKPHFWKEVVEDVAQELRRELKREELREAV